MENDLLYISLQKYYNNTEKSNYLLKYLKYEKISLRIIDWFITNYSKKNDTIYNIYKKEDFITLSDGEYLQQFNVFRSYKSQLKSFSKRNFDPFCRRNRINYMIFVKTILLVMKLNVNYHEIAKSIKEDISHENEARGFLNTKENE